MSKPVSIPSIEPLPPYLPVRRACLVGSFSRSRLYEAIGRGEVEAVKDGAKTLIVTASLLARMSRLPAAKVAVSAKDRRKAAQQKGGAQAGA
jgi:hypothetical protein